jgi:hypothetical protein
LLALKVFSWHLIPQLMNMSSDQISGRSGGKIMTWKISGALAVAAACLERDRSNRRSVAIHLAISAAMCYQAIAGASRALR